MRSLAPFGFLFAFTIASPALAAQNLVSVDVALTDVSLNKVAFLIAADTGLYAKQGLDVHQFISPVAAEVARRSGVVVPPQYVREDIESAPIEVGGGSPMMYRVATDPKAIHRVILATTESHIRFHVIVSPGINRVEELKGKRLGYGLPGNVTHVGAVSWVKRMGWVPGKDIELVANANSLNPLKEGKVDAVLGSPMLNAMAPEMNLKDIADLEPYNIPVAGSGIMAERGWLRSNHDAAARFVKASVEAFALMKKDKAVFDASLAKWFNIQDATTQARMYADAADIPKKPYPSVDGIKSSMEIYDSPDMRKHVLTDFYDASFIADLDRSGFIDALYK
jgi:ABC-type nitrate/sulfonate/bicarbonate transport system substrate-binding protein